LVGSYQCFGETCSLLSSALSPEAAGFSKTLVSVYKAMWCHSSEDGTLVRVFKNSIHGRMFGHEREIVKRMRRTLCNKEAYYLFSSPSKSVLRKLLRVRHVADSGS